MAEKLVHEKDTWFVENFKGKDNLEINPETNKDVRVDASVSHDEHQAARSLTRVWLPCRAAWPRAEDQALQGR